MEFYSRDGVWLGNKISLIQQIHEISGIAIPAIEGSSLLDFGIEERFQWAKFRQTTKDEDSIYCLWGIFGVSLPVMYGEGLAGADRRLRREIANAGRSSAAIAQSKLCHSVLTADPN